eukprot:jgi/Phyca11/132116/e_gw1.136.16.1
MSYRYLAPRDYFPLGRYFAENYFNTLSDDDFRQLTRTSRDGFRGILTRIEGHRIFTNSSNYEQAPVWLQLAVALDRLGTNGNGSSLGRTRLLWGIGKGTAHLYTARVLSAVNAVADEFVAWPDYQERRRISRRMALQGFPGCVGFIDGTTIPLSQKPAVDGQCYFNRKHRYSVNAQVVCDDHRKIIAIYCGWPGLALTTPSIVRCRSQKMTKRRGFSVVGNIFLRIQRTQQTFRETQLCQHTRRASMAQTRRLSILVWRMRVLSMSTRSVC